MLSPDLDLSHRDTAHGGLLRQFGRGQATEIPINTQRTFPVQNALDIRGRNKLLLPGRQLRPHPVIGLQIIQVLGTGARPFIFLTRDCHHFGRASHSC